MQELADHDKILNSAAANKFTKTFEILINAGFDPLKHEAGTTNSFALACATQGKSTLESYLESIKNKFGSEAAESVIREKDFSEKSALDHTIGGRAYLGVINFLLSNGAKINQNYSENLQTTANLGHAGAFEFLLRKGNLEGDELTAVFESVKNAGDYVITSIFLEHLKEKNPEMAASLKEELPKKLTTLTDQDLFKICQLSGEKTLKYYLKARPDYDLKSHINDLDENGKTALYYAVNDNAYNSLVSFLLNHDANPNLIGGEENAASLAIKNSEPATLDLLLNSQKLSNETVAAAAAELIKPENNEIILTESFICGLEENKLKLLPAACREVLLKRSLESEKDECIYKVRRCNVAGDLLKYAKNLFFESIENSDFKMVKALIEKFQIKTLLTESVQKQITFAEDSEPKETRGLLERDSHGNNYGATQSPNTICKVKHPLNNRFADLAVETVERFKRHDSDKLEDAVKISNFLRAHGFETSKNTQDSSIWRICPTDSFCNVM